MKKNPGRADRRRMAKKNRKATGRIRMKLDNWKKHFESYSRKVGREHRAWVKEQAKYHLIGKRRWKRLGKIVVPDGSNIMTIDNPN